MWVSATETQGTIGGGNLEYTALKIAREMLLGAETRRERRFALGDALGAVDLLGDVGQLDHASVAIPRRQLDGGRLDRALLAGEAVGPRLLPQVQDLADLVGVDVPQDLGDLLDGRTLRFGHAAATTGALFERRRAGRADLRFS